MQHAAKFKLSLTKNCRCLLPGHAVVRIPFLMCVEIIRTGKQFLNIRENCIYGDEQWLRKIVCHFVWIDCKIIQLCYQQWMHFYHVNLANIVRFDGNNLCKVFLLALPIVHKAMLCMPTSLSRLPRFSGLLWGNVRSRYCVCGCVRAHECECNKILYVFTCKCPHPPNTSTRLSARI